MLKGSLRSCMVLAPRMSVWPPSFLPPPRKQLLLLSALCAEPWGGVLCACEGLHSPHEYPHASGSTSDGKFSKKKRKTPSQVERVRVLKKRESFFPAVLTRGSHFHFALGSTNYIDGSAYCI